MNECLHGEFWADVEVTRFAEHPENTAEGYTANIRIKCVQCGIPFVFMGLPGGSHPEHPTENFDGTEARMPIQPQEDAD